MKRWLGIPLFIVLIVCVSAALAADPGAPFELVIENGTITGYTGDPREAPDLLEIPDGVTKIASEAFRSTSVSYGAFYPTFTKVVFPASLEEIGMSAFSGLPELTAIVFNGGERLNAKQWAFSQCKKLAAVQFSGELRKLEGWGIFTGCTALESITFPDSLLTLSAMDMFAGCTSLKTVNFSDPSKFSVSPGMFNGCTSLTGSPIPLKGSIPYQAFLGCAALKKVKGGSGLVTVSDAAFKGCKALTSFTFGKKVKTIGKEAFRNCKKLKAITIKTTLLTAKTVGKNAFKGVASKPTVKCPKSKLKEYKKLLVKKGIPKKARFK